MRFLLTTLLAAAALGARLPGYPDRLQRTIYQMEALQDEMPDPEMEMEIIPGSVPLDETVDLMCPEELMNVAGDIMFTPNNPDGTCHNVNPLASRFFGASSRTQMRSTPPVYEEGDELNVPVTNRPMARDISNMISAQGTNVDSNTKTTTALLIFFGQFLDHDYALTAELEEEEDEFNIEVSADEAINVFNLPAGSTEIIFHRSVSVPDENGLFQYLNLNTPWLDLSNVYGDTLERNAIIVDEETGLLVVEDIADVGEFPPNLDENGMPGEAPFCGDIRCTENSMLFSWHTLWLRNHNRLARLLQEREELDAVADAMLIYELARHLNIASYQTVFYTAYLPYLVGRLKIDEMLGDFVLNPALDPRSTLEFTTAAFRYGHSGLVNDLTFTTQAGITSTMPLAMAFDNIEPVIGGAEQLNDLFRGMGAIEHPRLDALVVDAVRNELFANLDMVGDDLVSRNIQRGRDHGLGTFNDIRAAFGAPRVPCGASEDVEVCFGRLTEGTRFAADATVASTLADLYTSFDDVDLFIAGMVEIEWEDSLLGETFTRILLEQFNRMRSGDVFWYENQQFDMFPEVTLPYRIEQILDLNAEDGVTFGPNLMQLSPVVAPWVTPTTGYCEFFLSNEIKNLVTSYTVTLTSDGAEVPNMVDLPLDVTDQFMRFTGLESETEYTCTFTAVGADVPAASTLIGSANFVTDPAPIPASASTVIVGVSVAIASLAMLFV